VSLTKKLKKNSPEDSVMRSSDTFSEMQVLKTGRIDPVNSLQRSMNNWYASLRQHKSIDKNCNYIKRIEGKSPIYALETCHLQDYNI